MLNSRVDVEMKGHPGYQCDTIEWAVDVCDRVGSDRLKILFDIYHVQIMQGDVIVRLKKYKDYIAHYHTAGNPGRNEIDDTQEIHYPGIMKAIAETGYKGFVGQEFIPTWKDPVARPAARRRAILRRVNVYRARESRRFSSSRISAASSYFSLAIASSSCSCSVRPTRKCCRSDSRSSISRCTSSSSSNSSSAS